MKLLQFLSAALMAVFPLLATIEGQALATTRALAYIDECMTAHQSCFELSLDILLLRPNAGKLEYANTPAITEKTADFTKAPLIKPHFHPHVGFRERLTYSPSDQNYSFSAVWTHIKNKARGKTVARPQEGFFPVWILAKDALRSDFVTYAKEDWKGKTNIYDAVFAYRLYRCSWLTLTPWGGVRGACIDQNIHIDYQGGLFPSFLNSKESDHIKMGSRFFGVGPLIGIDPEIFFCQNRSVSLFASVSSSILFGKAHTRQKESYFEHIRYQKDKNVSQNGVVIDAMAGLKVTISCFSCATPSISIGWEFHEFFNQNRLSQNHFHLLSCHGNVKYSGGFLRGSLEF